MQCAAWKYYRPSLVRRVVHQHPPLRLRWRFWPGRALYLSQSVGPAMWSNFFTIISAFQNPVIFALAVPRWWKKERHDVNFITRPHYNAVSVLPECAAVLRNYQFLSLPCGWKRTQHCSRMKMLYARDVFYYFVCECPLLGLLILLPRKHVRF